MEEVAAQPDDVALQDARVLLQGEERPRQPFGLGVLRPTDELPLGVLLPTGVHARLHPIGVRCALDPLDAERQPTVRRRFVPEQQRRAAVRQHPAQELLLEGQDRLLHQLVDQLRLPFEITRLHPGRESLRSYAHGPLGVARAHREPGVLQRVHARAARSGEGDHLRAAIATECAVHHHAVRGHELFGRGGAAGQQVDLGGRHRGLREQSAHSQRSHFYVRVRHAAALV